MSLGVCTTEEGRGKVSERCGNWFIFNVSWEGIGGCDGEGEGDSAACDAMPGRPKEMSMTLRVALQGYNGRVSGSFGNVVIVETKLALHTHNGECTTHKTIKNGSRLT